MSKAQADIFKGDFADGPRPVIWVRSNDPRYKGLARRWADEKPPQSPPAPAASKYFSSDGWAFPADWVGW